jgi:argininosuccinate lyase
MDTGRLSATLGPRTRRIVYGTPDPAAISRELRAMSHVDLAHVVMLVERQLVTPAVGAALLREILRLREQDFRELHGAAMPRGLYLAYEQYLSRVLGPEVGGCLHTGRSRNDLTATVTALRLRAESTRLAGEAVRLQAVLLGRARAHRDAVMPVYTHFQPAMPVTYGHYLLGVAVALSRDITALRHVADGCVRSPLGAAAVAGTDLPIDPVRTAALLGFEGPPLHAIDAVASRDTALRLVGAACGAALTLNRLAVDLQLWSTAEFDLVTFPDRLVGSSSAMPQKRNTFLLEHLKAKAGTVMGSWVAVAGATKSTPFTNTIEVNTEAVQSAWPGLRATLDALELAQVLVGGARPRSERMVRRARESFVTATAAANSLVRDGVPFRAAHHAVGAAVRRVVTDAQLTLASVTATVDGTDHVVPMPDPVDAVASQLHGGGPGAFSHIFAATRAGLAAHASWVTAARRRAERADEELRASVAAITEGAR